MAQNWQETMRDDGSEGPLTLARRYLALHCAHRSRGCSVWVETILQRRHVPDDVDCLVKAAHAIQYDLPRVNASAVDCLTHTASMLIEMADVRLMRADAHLMIKAPEAA